jgi:hypothetical protein
MPVTGPVAAALAPVEVSSAGGGEPQAQVAVELRFAPPLDDGGMPINRCTSFLLPFLSIIC